MNTGFNLKTASLEIRKCARALGISSGRWEPVNHDRHSVVIDSPGASTGRGTEKEK